MNGKRRDFGDFRDFKAQLPKIPLRLIGYIAAMVIALILLVSVPLTMFYTVEPEQEGVVLRLGKLHTIVQSGLHWKLPFGIDTVEFVPTTELRTEDFGTETGGVREVSLMLTGDLNIAEIRWSVQYQIGDPEKYLYKVRQPEETLRDVSESAMRLVVGDISITDVLTEKRKQIGDDVKQKIQELLDGYEAGIIVTSVNLLEVNPPPIVKAAYEEVNEARLEKETTINQARQEYLREIPEARGQARQMEAEAEGLKIKRIQEAEGDVAKFEALYAEYQRAPEVTRARLYLETFLEVLPQLQQIYILDEQQGGPLQVLDLKQAVGGALRSRSTQTPASRAIGDASGRSRTTQSRRTSR